MNDADRGQVNQNAAQIYETFFVPALFDQWPAHIIQTTGIQPGQRVLDVACGTGILARQVSDCVGTAGTVTGIDSNKGMLAVAEAKAPHITWQYGKAESLPFDDHSFDAVVSQFGLMFFEDRSAALREMWRVLRPGGTCAVAVWDKLENTPGYAAMVTLLEKLFGEQLALGLRAPFVLGDVAELQSLFNESGLSQATITTYAGTARFASIKDWVYINIKGWVLADALDDDQFNQLLRAAEQSFTAYVTDRGTVAFDAPAHIITVTK